MGSSGAQQRIDWSSLYRKEDWWALWIGLLLFFLSLPALQNVSFLPGIKGLLGWVPAGRKWTSLAGALGFGAAGPASAWAWLGLFAAWLFLLAVLVGPMKLMGVRPRQFAAGFSLIYWLAMGLWVLANYKPIVSVVGSGEMGFVFALIVGIVLGNLPRLPDWLRLSAKGEFFIKTAIVLLGARILFSTLATVIGPIVESALLSFPVAWLVGYYVSRRLGLERKFAATLGSGVGVCGVSAAIATAAAVDAPPIYATLVASIIVVFSAVELLVLPYVAVHFFPHNPYAAGAWMGLSVKTDGAAAASGSVVSGLMGLGPSGTPAVIAATEKVMIDIWIGIIAFILAVVFVYFLERPVGVPAAGSAGPDGPAGGVAARRVSPLVIWYRFPKFVLGYFFTSAVLSAIAFTYPSLAAGQAAVARVTNFGTTPLQVMFFAFTFVSIGVATRFSALRQVGLGRPILAYALSLLFAIAWGGFLAWVFFR